MKCTELTPKKGNPRNISGAKYKNGQYYIANCTCGFFATGVTKEKALSKLRDIHRRLQGGT